MLADKVKEQSWYQDVNMFVGFLFVLFADVKTLAQPPPLSSLSST